nr:MAG: cytosine deaminase [Actinomycetota bacterium]
MSLDFTVYTAAVVLPVTAPPIAQGSVAVRDGRIVHVGERRWVQEQLAERGARVREVFWHGILTPGLVNAHTHLQYTAMASLGAVTYPSFGAWVEAFNREYAASHDWRASAADGARLAIRTGTTAAADVVTDAAAASALHDAGLRGIAYWEVMDWSNERWVREGRRRVEAELEALPATPGRGLAPHAPYSLETVALMETPDIARERGARLHIHLGEIELERAFEHDAGEPWHARRPASLKEIRTAGLGISATDYVDHLGVLGPDCHIAHGVYMTAQDRALLRQRHTTVALCPRSNAVLGLDEPPVAAYLREGSPIAVGTDSLASSPSLDVMADVAELARLARAQGYADADLASRLLTAATLGGARALGLDSGTERIGQLSVGARADLAFFDLEPSGPEHAADELVEHGAGRAAGTVLGGRFAYAEDRLAHQEPSHDD